MPETKYARVADNSYVAFQVIGDGPIDLVYTAGWFGHVEAQWEYPALARFLERLASFSPLICLTAAATVCPTQWTSPTSRSSSRVQDFAGPGEVMVSRTVVDLVARVRSGLSFADRGEHDLKGVPGRWHLYAVEG